MGDYPWYKVQNEDELDSPSLLVFPDRVRQNIQYMLQLAGSRERLMPHLKTNKCAEVIQMYLDAGIDQFKVSTLAEAELAALSGAGMVLVAHQLVGPKVSQLIQLKDYYPQTEFQILVDDHQVAARINEALTARKSYLKVWIDVNSGMDRSGISPGLPLFRLADAINKLSQLTLVGLHVYDGHLRQADFTQRQKEVISQFQPILESFKELLSSHPGLQLVAGGTPSFSVHAQFEDRICSPGTCVFWDWGYGSILTEQPFQFAVVLASRVISKPVENKVTLDMGHKAVAPENPIDKRIHWLSRSGELIGQSEEHGVVQVDSSAQITIGDLWYGIPYHICPTINLYQELNTVKDGIITGSWKVLGAQRKIKL